MQNSDGEVISIYTLGRSPVKVGRRDQDSQNIPDIDLSSHDNRELNEVSRFHAEIVYKCERVVKDSNDAQYNKYRINCKSDKGIGVLKLHQSECTIINKHESCELENYSLICFVPGELASLYYKEGKEGDEGTPTIPKCNRKEACILKNSGGNNYNKNLNVDCTDNIMGDDFHDDVLNATLKRVTLGGKSYELSPIKFKFFSYLYRRSLEKDENGDLLNGYYDNKAIARAVWNYNEYGVTNYTDTSINQNIATNASRLNELFGKKYIQNKSGIGYRFYKNPE